MTGLLRCVAIELKVTADNNQVSQFGNMCKILLGIVQSSGGQGVESMETHQSIMHSSLFGETLSTTGMTQSGKMTDTSAGLLICKLLECFEFEIQPIERPKWDYFDNALMQELFQVRTTSLKST